MIHKININNNLSYTKIIKLFFYNSINNTKQNKYNIKAIDFTQSFKKMKKQIFESSINLTQQIKYVCTQMFFISSDNYLPFDEDIQKKKIDIDNGKLPFSVFFQCTGNGSFRKSLVAKRFIDHLQSTIHRRDNISKIKLKISGFDLKQKGLENFLTHIATLITKIKKGLNSLQIRVTRMTNCTGKDFKSLFEIGFDHSLTFLNNLSYEFSDWQFYQPGTNIQKRQLSLKQLTQFIYKSFEGSMGQSIQCVKRLRLQISTWYYIQKDSKQFFRDVQPKDYQTCLINMKKVDTPTRYFHHQMIKLIRYLLNEVMTGLTHFQVDFRNWHQSFDMNTLKNDLLNVRNQMKNSSFSNISKRHTSIIQKMVNQSFIQNKAKQDIGEQKTFDILVIV